MIIYFLLLNALIFLPAYLLNWKKSTFLPLQLFEKPISIKTFLANFIRRYNFDIFRFAGDFAFITLIILGFKNIIPIAFTNFFIFFYLVFAIIHQTYYHSIKYIYNTEPLLINDIILIKRGLGIAFHGFKIWLIVTIVVFVIIIFQIKLCIDSFVSSIYANQTTPYITVIFLSFVIFCAIYSIKRYSNFKSVYGFLCFIIPTVKLLENIKASVKQRQKLKQLRQLEYAKLNQTNTLQLNIKKNIFLIAVESYGSLVYDNSKFQTFNKLIKNLDQKLNKSGWKVSTNFSESPISGGTSWLSYSTLLKGMHIDSESIYSYLFSDNQHLKYEPFLKRLQNNNYRTYLLSSIGGYEKMKIPWERTLRFLGIQNAIKYKDLTYTGKHFGFGPSPPDQYSLNKAYELIKKKSGNNPFAMFWLTLNSHYPWDSPEEIIDSWKLLNEKQDKYWIDNNLVNAKKYEKAMMYQINFLIDFILKKGTENDIFVLIGDHQPFHIAELDNAKTPLHIISKDEQFVNAFEYFGFSKGLLPNNNYNVSLKHAGIQSLLIKIINETYGTETSTTYYKNGINDF